MQELLTQIKLDVSSEKDLTTKDLQAKIIAAKEYISLLNEINKKVDDLAIHQAKSDQLQNSHIEWANKIEVAKKTLDFVKLDNATELAQHDEILTNKQIEIKSLKDSIATLQRNNTGLISESEGIRDNISVLQTKESTLQRVVGELTSKETALKNTIVTLEDKQAEISKEILAKQEHSGKLSSDIAILEARKSKL